MKVNYSTAVRTLSRTLAERTQNIDYIDAYNAVFMKNNSCAQIFSYDKDFDRIENIKRMEP